MPFDNWLAFVAAYTVISLIPGPSVLMVTGIAVSRGLRAALWCIAGELLGGVFLVTLSLLGVGALLASSALLFQMVKWAGILYMGYLGARQIIETARQTDKPMPEPAPAQPHHSSLRAGFVTALFNPKAILFYVAFLSQFLDPAAPFSHQLALVLSTSTVIVGLVLGGYALLGARVRARFQSARTQRGFGYAGGGFLLGGSLAMAATR